MTKLPLNTKYILSTIPNHGNILDLVKRLISKSYLKQSQFHMTELESIEANSLINEKIKSQILEVNELDPIQAEQILNNWLLSENKCLSDEQWIHLRNLFNQRKPLQLYLKIIRDIAMNWRSYDSVDPELMKCLHTDELIIYLFRRLEAVHGKTIFRRAICYMTVCKNGITDNELEDILSLDDDVLYSVFQFHMPPIRRLPKILWVRIKNDLLEYIVEREANDTKITCWYHRRFVEVSLKNYVEKLDKKESESIYQNIFDFYNETWKGKQKPFELNPYLKQKLQSNNENQADRFLSPQPIEFRTQDGTVIYNKRKLTELPYCLSRIGNEFALKKASQLVYFNYEFMHAKFTCFSIEEIYEDLNRLLDQAKVSRKAKFLGYTHKRRFLSKKDKILWFFRSGDIHITVNLLS